MLFDEVFPPLFQEALAHALVDVFREKFPRECGYFSKAMHEVQRVTQFYTTLASKPAEGNWPHPDVWAHVISRMPDGDRVALQRSLMIYMALLTPEENGHG